MLLKLTKTISVCCCYAYYSYFFQIFYFGEISFFTWTRGWALGAWLKRYNTVMTRTLIYYGYNQYFYYISKNYKNLKYSSRVSVIGSCHFLNTPQTNAPQHNSNTTKNHLKHPLNTRNTPQTPKTFLKHPLNYLLTPKTPLKHSSNTHLTPL